MTTAEQRAQSYVKRIRNDRKREYGQSYLSWTLNQSGDDPVTPDGLSFMGAQAVRLALYEILGYPKAPGE